MKEIWIKIKIVQNSAFYFVWKTYISAGLPKFDFFVFVFIIIILIFFTNWLREMCDE